MKRAATLRLLLSASMVVFASLPVSLAHASAVMIDEFSDANGVWPYAWTSTTVTDPHLEVNLSGVAGGVRRSEFNPQVSSPASTANIVHNGTDSYLEYVTNGDGGEYFRMFYGVRGTQNPVDAFDIPRPTSMSFDVSA